jgi:hypothetical protein
MVTIPNVDPHTASLTDLQRAYSHARECVHLADTAADVQLAVLVQAQVASYRRARIVRVARQYLGDPTIGIGYLTRSELELASVSDSSHLVQVADRRALGDLDESAHLRSLSGVPGRFPVSESV